MAEQGYRDYPFGTPVTQMATNQPENVDDDSMMVFQQSVGLHQVILVSYRPVTGQIIEWGNAAASDYDLMLTDEDGDNPTQDNPPRDVTEENESPDDGPGFGGGPPEEPMSIVEEVVAQEGETVSGRPRNKRLLEEEEEEETDGLSRAQGSGPIKRMKTD